MEQRVIDESINSDSNKYKKEIMIWQIIGGVVIFSLGALWHFIFEWTDGWAPIGWLLPVNESVWEHVKLMFWPALLFYIVEGIFLYKKTNNFIFAKFLGFYFVPISSMIIFFFFFGAFEFESFIFDSIVLGILIGIQQVFSYKLLTRDQPILGNKHIIVIIIASIFIVLLAVLLIVFTYYPPQIPLFEHHIADNTGIYGILDEYGHDH